MRKQGKEASKHWKRRICMFENICARN